MVVTSSGWRRHHRRADDVIGLESEEMTVVRSSERLGGDEFKGQNDALFKGRKQKKKKKNLLNRSVRLKSGGSIGLSV